MWLTGVRACSRSLMQAVYDGGFVAAAPLNPCSPACNPGASDDPQDTYRALPQHRHQRAHRRRQDHHHRTHPVLHRRQSQDRRGAQRRGHHGLDGAGAGARHHHHLGRHHRLLEGHGRQFSRAPHQHHRYARPRRLHHRSGALDARARRRRDGVRRGRRRAAAVGDGLAPGQQIQGAAHRLHQQDGPRRRRLFPRAAADPHAG